MKKFKRIYIEITNVCNLSCDFCPKTGRKPGFIDILDFENVLNKIEGYTDNINLHVLGEPLLHPHLGDLLDRAASHNLRVNLTTNGTLISKVGDMIINKSALKLIYFSLHSFDANQSLISADKYLDDIFDFIRLVEIEKRIMVSLRLWNIEECRDISNREYKSDYTLQRIEKEFNISFNLKEKFLSERSVRLSSNVVLSKASRFEWPDIVSSEGGNKGFCHGLRDQIAVLVDGTVVPCCLDGEGVINLGNIFNMSMEEILESPKARAMYEGFSRREAVEELCQKCSYRKRFDK